VASGALSQTRVSSTTTLLPLDASRRAASVTVGVGNIMLIGVLERRSEIGLRRALGATKANIRGQFLGEAILLALLGGASGVAAGVLATAIYAQTKNWTLVIPTTAWAGGLAAALLIGAIAGLVPALRAARMSPTEALRTA
jgi:putative ABC transport system permease protein